MNRKRALSLLSMLLIFALPFSASATPIDVSAESSRGGQRLQGVAEVAKFRYDVKVDILLSNDGLIKDIRDNGSNPSGKNVKYWNRFLDGNGFAKFLDNDKAAVEQMNMSGKVDGVSGATYTAKAVKAAVLAAMAEAVPVPEPPAPTPEPPNPTPEPEMDEWHTGSAEVAKYHYLVQLKVLVNDKGEVVAALDNGTTPLKNKPWWDAYIDEGGLEKFVGKDKTGVENMDMNDDVDGISGATYSAKAAQQAVLIALEDALPTPPAPTPEPPTPTPEPPSPTPEPPAVDRWYSGSAVVKDLFFSVKLKVLLDDGVIKAVEDDGTVVKGKNSKYWKKFVKHGGLEQFLDKDFDDVKKIKWSKKLSHKKGMTYTSRAAQQAVLNALTQETPSQSPDSDNEIVTKQWLAGSAKVKKYDFYVKIKIRVDEAGNIIAVKNNGTKVKGKNKKYWKWFRKEGGLDLFINKDREAVEAMVIDDSFSRKKGTIYTARAAKEAVLEAYSKAVS